MNDHQSKYDAMIPRADAVTRAVSLLPRMDTMLAPIWAEKLRHTYSKVLEIKFPQYACAEGAVLPIDSSIPAGATSTEYFQVEGYGFADWMSDDGSVLPSGAVTGRRFTGELAEMAHKYEVTLPELERAEHARMDLPTYKQSAGARAIAAFTNWVWAFGDTSKNLRGLFNHPNITVSVAAVGASTSRAVEDKTVDEILADVAVLVNTVAEQTLGAYFVTKVFMPREDMNTLNTKRVGAGDGSMTIMQLLKETYSGDPATGQPGVSFHVLNECTAANRLHPKTGTDDSGITGRFWIGLPAENKDELSFELARPLTQEPPQQVDLKLDHIMRSKIGGCKCQIPLAVHRLDFLV